MEPLIECKEITCEELECIRKENNLEMLWDCEESDYLYSFHKDEHTCAVIRLSPDPIDEEITWIDEFEVIRNFRDQGIGKSIICDLLKDSNIVKIYAKNELTAKFWEKCGFQYDGATWDEIPIIYFKDDVQNEKVRN